MRHLCRYAHKRKLCNHNQLSQLQVSKNNVAIRNYSHYKHNLSKFPLLNHQTFAFSTSKEDIQSKEPVIESTQDDKAITSEEEQTTTVTIPSKPNDPRRPLIHIHDEERPQLSISLPNRWPFKRLARKPTTPSEPLNMHEMTTFSGLPAQTFMPTAEDEAKTEAFKAQQKQKTEQEKKREARIKFWKRYSMVLLFTPLLLYIFDNRKAKKMATRRAEYVSSAASQDARSIRDMALLNNAQLIDLYYWILNEECNNDVDASMTIDQFGQLFVNAVNIFKKRKEVNGGRDKEKDIRLSREYDDELTAKDKKRELKWLTKKYDMVKTKRLTTKTKELQPWDISIFFTEYNLASSSVIPLKTLFIALSQITTDTLYNKAEIAFRIFTQQIEQKQAEVEITYNALIELIDDMIITGHFTTDSLITRRSYFPSQFGILNSEEICDMIFKTAELDKNENGNGCGCIKFVEFGEALMTLSEGRKFWEGCIGFFLPTTYKPWLMVWYCSDRSKGEIADEKRKEERRLKRLEEKRKKKEQKNLNVDTNDDVHVQTN